jgi:ribonuclease T2
MIQYWPDVQYTTDDPQYDSFWIHEWSKHGTCSGLTQLQYFNETIQLTQQIPTPSILTESVGNNMSACVLRDNMGGANNVVLQCKNQILTGAYTCWNQTNDIPTIQIACPSSVVKEDTCMQSDDIQVVGLN